MGPTFARFPLTFFVPSATISTLTNATGISPYSFDPFEFSSSPLLRSMAAVSGSSISLHSRSLSFQRKNQATTALSSFKSVSFLGQRKSFPSVSLQPVPLRFRVSCAAKQETVDKVCEIVRKQLALPADSAVTGESKFSQLGADSLDTVEIVMGLEEAFGISVEEESAQSITTVQDAADLIEKLVEKKDD